MELHKSPTELHDWIMELHNYTYLWINMNGKWSSIIDIWNAVNELCSWKIHICSSHTLYMEFHNNTPSSMNAHGVPWLIMELLNWNYMSSIDNYGTPYSFTLFFCPVGTPYALIKRTGLILAECIPVNIYDMKLFLCAIYRITRPWLFIKSLNVTVCWCTICLSNQYVESIKHKRLWVTFLWLYTMMTSGNADRCIGLHCYIVSLNWLPQIAIYSLPHLASLRRSGSL